MEAWAWKGWCDRLWAGEDVAIAFNNKIKQTHMVFEKRQTKVVKYTKVILKGIFKTMIAKENIQYIHNHIT
jgi:hypothetical protein